MIDNGTVVYDTDPGSQSVTDSAAYCAYDDRYIRIKKAPSVSDAI